MSESTSLREAIARAARGALDAYYAQPNDDMQLAEEDVITDAVLAVLRDLPNDVIERATNAVHASLLDECGAGSSLLYCAPEADSDGFLEVQGAVDLPHLVRDLLRAAFGGEQA